MKKFSLLRVLLIILIGSYSTVIYGQGNYPPSLDPISWNLILEDEFTDLSSNEWFKIDWCQRNKKFDANNVFIDTVDDKLHIKVTELSNPFPCVDGQGNTHWNNYSGGELRSGVSFSEEKGNFKYGYFEIMASNPNTLGFWPALWLSIRNGPGGTWPPELDILEIRGRSTTEYIGTIHIWDDNYPNNDKFWQIIKDDIINPNDMSTYAVDWSESNIDYYFKNERIAGTNDETWLIHDELSLVIGMNADKTYPPTISTNFDEHLVVDYVKVYKKNWHYTHYDNAAEFGVAGDIAVSPDGNKVFYRNTSGAIKGMYWDSNSWTWKYTDWNNAAGSNVAGDIVVSPNGTKVFYLNTSGAIKGMYWDNNSRTWKYTNWNNAAGSNVAGDIAVGPDGTKVFYRNTSGAIKGMYWDSNSWTWKYTDWNNAAGSNVAGNIVVSPNGTKVFYLNTSGAIKGMYWDNNSRTWKYTNWNNAAGSNVAGDIAVGPDGTKVFYRNTSGAIKGMYWDSNSWTWKYTNWNNVAGTGVAGDLVVNSDGIVFYRNFIDGINGLYYYQGQWYNGALNNVVPSTVDNSIAVSNTGKVFYLNQSGAIKGFYYKEINDPLGSDNESDNITDIVSATIENSTLPDNIVNIYPNPNNGNFIIHYKSEFINKPTIQIINSFGKIILNQSIDSENMKFDISNYSNGVYFIKIVSDSHVFVKSIVKTSTL